MNINELYSQCLKLQNNHNIKLANVPHRTKRTVALAPDQSNHLRPATGSARSRPGLQPAAAVTPISLTATPPAVRRSSSRPIREEAVTPAPDQSNHLRPATGSVSPWTSTGCSRHADLAHTDATPAVRRSSSRPIREEAVTPAPDQSNHLRPATGSVSPWTSTGCSPLKNTSTNTKSFSINFR